MAFSEEPGQSPAALLEKGNPTKPVLFFDVDNCLYPQDSGVQEEAWEGIYNYIKSHVGLDKEQAAELCAEYSKTYGFLPEGLVRHHSIDAKHYNSTIDEGLPIEALLKPDPKLRQLLQDIDRSKVRLWLFSNADDVYVKRVVRHLEIDDCFEGLSYCDYARVPLLHKPKRKKFQEAMKDAGIESITDCYFVDDSYLNCRGAQDFGWTAMHLIQDGFPTPPSRASQHQIKSLEELRVIFPQWFKN
uniref:Pyrimidine 5'-nucleotidase n=1 Tax=Bionectria ochroleuca TaxID=29856 RepID=A0A8H7NBB6_BIOOC